MSADSAQIAQSTRNRLIAAAIGAILLWGVSFSAMRFCMRSFHPVEFALGRYVIASVCLLLMTPWIRAPLPALRELPMVLVLACSGISAYNLFLNFGISHMHTGPASFINNSSALFAALLATSLLGERPSLTIWMGIATSLGGILLIAHAESAGGGLSSAAFFLVCSAICYGLYSVLQKPLLASRGPFWVVCWSMWIGTAMMLPWAPGLVREVTHAAPSAEFWLLFVGLFPTVVGFLLWSWCLSQAPVSKISPALYAVPVVSIMTAWLTLGERPSHEALIGCGVVIAGVLLGARGTVRGQAIAVGAPAAVAAVSPVHR